MRPSWDCITKDMWYKAYRIMRKARKKSAYEMIQYDKVIAHELIESFTEYTSKIQYKLCDYFFKEFYKPL